VKPGRENKQVTPSARECCDNEIDAGNKADLALREILRQANKLCFLPNLFRDVMYLRDSVYDPRHFIGQLELVIRQKFVSIESFLIVSPFLIASPNYICA